MLRRCRRGESAGFAGDGPCRLAIVYNSAADLRAKLERAENLLCARSSESLTDASGIYYEPALSRQPSIAFLYPGQGSQSVGMLANLRSALPGFEDQLLKLDAIWQELAGSSLLALIYGERNADTESRLRDTRQAQPALGIVSTAIRVSLESLGIRARFHAGHSYGELPALCAAGVMDFPALLRLSRQRGNLLGQAGDLTPGAMIALTGRREEVEALCQSVDPALQVVNFNSPSQFVVAGPIAAVERLEQAASSADVQARKLNTACAFHSSLMAPAADSWRAAVVSELQGKSANLRASAFSNVTGRQYSSTEEVVQLLSEQIVRPVQWAEICSNLVAAGANIFIESGPGRVLSDLMKRNLGRRGDCLVLPADPGPAPAREHVVNLLAQLYVRGVDVDWKKFADPGAIASFVEPPQEAVAARPERIEVNIFQANQELLDRYFRQQTNLVELAIQQTGPSECRMLLQTALESNERILNAVLAVNEQAVRGLLGNSATSPPAPSRTIAAPAPVDKRDTADEPAGDLASRVQQCLRAEITRVTGFPPEAITPDLSFTDLGIDSLSMAEIWGEVLDKMPELEEYADHIFEIHSLADIRKVWAPGNAAEAKASSKALAPSAPPQRPRWRELRPVLVDAISARLGIEALRILDSQDFDTELRLDVFTREELYRESLAHHPGYRLAGRELLNARNLFELGALLERFELPESAEAGQEAVTRFIRRREKVVLAAPARLPARVLLAGEASPGMAQLHQLLQEAGICVVSLQADVGGWCSGSERFRLDSISHLRQFADRTFGPRPFSVVFVAEGQAGCAEALETGVTSLFVLAKALWGEEEDRKSLNHFAVVGTPASKPVYHAARGLARSLRREFSDVPVNCVWLQSNLADVERSGLLDALFSDRLEHDVFEERGQFYREVAEPNSLAAVDNSPALDLSHTSRVLILGGGDGISAEIGVGLAQTYGCEIVAIGRTPWPAGLPYAEIEPGPEAERLIKRKLYEEIEASGRVTGDLLQQRWRLVSRQRALWFTKSRIEAAGGRFEYYSADARDAVSLRSTLDKILAQGPVHGVIHGAGVIRDSLLAQKTVDEFRDVVKTKAIPAVVLREVLQSQPLAFAFFLSSMTSFTGTAGQTDYASANEILNAVAADWNRSATYPVKSLLWSVWTEAGLAGPAMRNQMQRMGLGGIPTTEGVRLLLDELKYGRKQDDWVLFAPQSTLRYSMNYRNVPAGSRGKPAEARRANTVPASALAVR